MSARPRSSAFARPHVLLAEDDADFRDLIADALALDGYDVTAVTSGAEAMNYIDIAFTDPCTFAFPSVVITDVRMPTVDGLGLLTYASYIPTIVMTAFGSAELHDEAYRRGACRVFDKPFSIGELRSVVQSLVGARVTELPRSRLLIADDDLDFVAYLSDLVLTRNAISVDIASSGVGVLEAIAERGPFDLVLTDHRMPGPSGMQLVAMLRWADYQGPILVITAFPGSEVSRVVRCHERVRLMPKSANPDQIINAAAQLISDGQGPYNDQHT